jgi:hypothetical protein
VSKSFDRQTGTVSQSELKSVIPLFRQLWGRSRMLRLWKHNNPGNRNRNPCKRKTRDSMKVLKEKCNLIFKECYESPPSKGPTDTI